LASNTQGIDLDKYLGEAIFLHYSGRKKPWRLPAQEGPAGMVEPELAAPWLDVLSRLDLQDAGAAQEQLTQQRATKKERIKALLVTEPRSGSEWMMDLLDAHPDICASGEREFPTNGFARESLIPGRWDLGVGDCTLKRGCMWSFVAEHVPKYVHNFDAWCSVESKGSLWSSPPELSFHTTSVAPDSELVSPALHATHGERLCQWAAWWRRTYNDADPFRGPNSTQRLFAMYESSMFDDSSELIPCSCSGQQTMLVKVMRGWTQQRRDPKNQVCSTGTGTHFGSEACGDPKHEYYTGNYNEQVTVAGVDGSVQVMGPTLNFSEYKIVELVRNRFDVCMSLLYSLASGIWHEDDSEGADDELLGQMEVNVSELVTCLEYKEQQRTEGWLNEQLAQRKEEGMVLTLEYEKCQDVGLDECYSSAVAFLTDRDATASSVGEHNASRATLPRSIVGATKLWQWAGMETATCTDDPNFRDAKHRPCWAWSGLDCSDLNGCSDYTSEDMLAVRSSCKESCGCEVATNTSERAVHAEIGLKSTASLDAAQDERVLTMLKQGTVAFLCETITPCPTESDVVVTKLSAVQHGADQAFTIRTYLRNGVHEAAVDDAVTKAEFVKRLEAGMGEQIVSLAGSQVVYVNVLNAQIETNEASVTAAGNPVFKYNGVMTKFELPPAHLTLLLRWLAPNGDRLELHGATFSGPGHTLGGTDAQKADEENEQQWFDHFVMHVNETIKVEVEVSEDIRNLGSFSRSFANAPAMRVRLDGEAKHASNLAADEVVSADGAVSVRMNSHALRKKSQPRAQRGDERHGERLHISAGGLNFEVQSRPARKFASLVDQVRYTHLDLKVLDQLPPSSTGLFAELGLVTTMSSETRKRVQHVSGLKGKVVSQRVTMPASGGVDAFVRATVLHQTRSKGAKEDFCCPITSDTQRAATYLQENTCPTRPKAVVALPDVEAQVMVSGLQKSIFRRRRTTLLDAGLRSQQTAHPNSYGPGCASSKQRSHQLDDMAVSLLSQEPRERKNITDPFNKVFNSRKVIVELARRGYASAYSGAKMLYFFSWPAGSGGEEVAAYLAKLEPQFIVPGSNATGEFDFEAFSRSSYQVEWRDHAVIAFGRGSSEHFFENFKTQKLSSRHVVSFGYLRDVQTQRLAFHQQFVAHTGQPLHEWLSGCGGVPRLQLDELKNLALNSAALEGESIQQELLQHYSGDVKQAWVGMNEHVAFVGLASNPLGTLCTMAKMTNLSIPWQTYGGDGAYETRRDNQASIFLRMNDQAAGSILAQNEAELQLHKLASEAFEGIAADLGCLEPPLQELAQQPLYYMSWDTANGGQELARYLSALPEEYVVPGSSIEKAGFDFEAFAQSAEAVAARGHAVIAFGEGLSAAEFFHAVQKRQLSRRYPVAIGVVRDVLAHRAALWTSHQAALAALSPSHHAKAAGGAEVSAAGQWLLSDTSRDMQVRRLSGVDPGEARTVSESLEAVEKQLQVGEHELHGAHKAKTRSSVSEFNLRAGDKADRGKEEEEEEEEVIPWERVLRQTHPSDLVLSAYNPLSSLCLLANVTGVPIPWEHYHRTKPALPDAVGSLAWQAGLAKPQHVPGNEGVLLDLTDKEIAALLEKNSQEVYTVARLHDRFEALSRKHGCLMPPGVLATAPTPAVQLLRKAEAAAAEHELPPLYYFMHTVKSGGAAVSTYFANLPTKYVVPGSTTLPHPFNFTELSKSVTYRGARTNRMDAIQHPIVAFSSSRLLHFVRELLPLKLTRRPVVFLGLARDMLLQRVSHYFEMSRQHRIEPLAAEPLLNQSHGTMRGWVASAEYSSLNWFKQLQPWLELHPAWAEQPVATMWRDLHDSRALDSYLASGIAGWQLAPYMMYNDSALSTHAQPKGRVRMGAIGVLSNLPATMCTFARLTGLPIDWEQDIQEKVKDPRPSELVPGWGHRTAAMLLSREPRETAFVALATSRLEELAAELGCMPAGPPASKEDRTRQAALSGSQRLSWDADVADNEPIPAAIYVLPSAAHSGSEVFGHLVASANVTTFLDFAGSCSADTKRATVDGTVSLMRNGCNCLYDRSDATGAWNRAFQCNGEPETCAKLVCDDRCGLKHPESCRAVAVFPQVEWPDLWDAVPPVLSTLAAKGQQVTVVNWVRSNAVKHAVAGLKHECLNLGDDHLTLLHVSPTLLLKYALGRVVDRLNAENLADFGKSRGLRTVTMQYEAVQRAPAEELKRFLTAAGFGDAGLPGEISLQSHSPEDLSSTLVNFAEVDKLFGAYPCLQRMLHSAEHELVEGCSREQTASLETELDEMLRSATVSSKEHRVVLASASIPCGESSQNLHEYCTRALEMSEAPEHRGHAGDVQVCSLTVARDVVDRYSPHETTASMERSLRRMEGRFSHILD
jgi:hypothetical protein